MSVEPEPIGDAGDHDNETRDDDVVTRRGKGQSFVRIARELGLRRGAEASEAFNRSLRRRPVVEQRQLRDEESARLDALAKRVDQNGDLSAQDKARQRQVLDRLRRRMLAPDDPVAKPMTKRSQGA